MSINYIIATWSGDRIQDQKQDYYEHILRLHLKTLESVEHNISKVTIMKPKNKVENSYYEINSNLPYEIVECENEFQSYGQWLKALRKNQNQYDYYIIVEDDYVPGVDNFDDKLIEIYEENSILCSLISDKPFLNLSISNSIISSSTLNSFFRKCPLPLQKIEEYKKWSNGGINYQLPFSKLFSENNIQLKDYNQYYASYFHEKNGELAFYSPKVVKYKDIYIFEPIQRIINIEDYYGERIAELESKLKATSKTRTNGKKSKSSIIREIERLKVLDNKNHLTK